MPPTGEQIQQLGEQGSQRAKRWLESTCRAEVKWNNPSVGIEKLQFRKAGAPADSDAQGDFFSFDLGGTMLGGGADGEVFLAESKKYATAADQGTEYRKFLAKCYRVTAEQGAFYDNFLWITWAPFLVNTWDELLTPTFVESAIVGSDACKYIALGDAPYDPVVGTGVASKVLVVVLADGQEVVLALHGDELMHVRKALLEFRTAS
ncbi:MAG: hypothetical protein QOI95_22 [Acidimicrobiaceae bacterium]|jgi:hypothetical protein